jgi:ketosteroid isomerase-like protein
MRQRVWCPLLACLFLPMAQAAAEAARPACAVWQRELSFARSVQQHDAAAFAAHVATDAVFNANTGRPTYGRLAITRAWQAFIVGKAMRIDWYPTQVVVSADGRIAYSSGRYLFEDTAPKATPHYTIGAFATVWRRGSDGMWRATFDGGDHGEPARDADVREFRAARQLKCPDNL